MDVPNKLIRYFPTCRAVWVKPEMGEEDSFSDHIIHCRTFQFSTPLLFSKIGLRLAQGYNKCGSEKEMDWIQNFCLLGFVNNEWQVLLDEKSLQEPSGIQWLEFTPLETNAMCIQIRKSGVDRWWPSWNIAMSGITFPTDLKEIIPSISTRNLLAMDFNQLQNDFTPMPDGVSRRLLGGEVRYKSRFLEIGFRLQKAALSYFSLDESGQSRTSENFISMDSFVRKQSATETLGYLVQGPRLTPVGMNELLGYGNAVIEGTTQIEGNRVSYQFRFLDIDQSYQIIWEIFEDSIQCSIERSNAIPLHAWNSSAWQFVFDTRLSGPVTALGSIIKQGETGLLNGSVVVHFPGKGSIEIEYDSPDTLIRFDSIRPLTINTLEFKIGETPQNEGDYLIKDGTFQTQFRMQICTPELCEVSNSAPTAIQELIRLRSVMGLVYRADTATMSNNGNSIHAPICLDSWTEIALGLHPWHGIRPSDYIQQTLERWLVDAPGYGNGRTIKDENQFYEDEYLQSGTSALFGLSLFLKANASEEWFSQFQPYIFEQLARMRHRDVDDDGLIESSERLGISGQYQWSTNWWDVLSFGWKDAFSNAFLYPALLNLAEVFDRLSFTEKAEECRSWALKLKENYLSMFYNEETGWLMGWRSKDDQIHDYAFLFVNGAAVEYGLIDSPMANQIMEKLWVELQKSDFKDYALGLPGNLWRILDADMAKAMHGSPMGTYENGAATHSQARHFVSGLYAVGMQQEADILLEAMARSMVDGSAFGGVGSGLDWRMWDGVPCGYEGFLCDQLGILVPAMNRWKRTQ